jgi:hypothetical protein
MVVLLLACIVRSVWLLLRGIMGSFTLGLNCTARASGHASDPGHVVPTADIE